MDKEQQVCSEGHEMEFFSSRYFIVSDEVEMIDDSYWLCSACISPFEETSPEEIWIEFEVIKR